MLSREYRLPATVSLTHAKYLKTPLFGAKYMQNGLSQSRFAFIVRKTTDKRAVSRNRIRRVFRSCIEELRSEMVDGYDMLFFLEKGIMNLKRDELREKVKNSLHQAHLLP